VGKRGGDRIVDKKESGSQLTEGEEDKNQGIFQCSIQAGILFKEYSPRAQKGEKPL